SHLIEHLVFKGTATRSAEAIARTMDSVGGQMDAFTTKEHTCFYVQVLDEHLPLAVDLLTDILLHPLFNADELEREKSVVLQEIKMVEDTPDDIIHDLIAGQIWAGHPLGRPILGSREAVTGYDRQTALGHFTEEYVPPRIIIAVAGNVTHDRVIKLFSTGFQGFDRGAAERTAIPPVLKPGVNIVGKTLEQVHLIGSLMLSLESTSSLMNRLAKHEMHHGTFLSMDAMLAAIDGVRHEEVQALVTELLDEDRLALTTLGPLDRRNLPRELLHH